MNSTLRISALARQLIDDLEALYYNAHLSAGQYDQAVQLVVDAFENAHLTLAEIDDASDSAFRLALASYAKLTNTRDLGCRWCFKCDAAYPPSQACPHFSPYRQIS